MVEKCEMERLLIHNRQDNSNDFALFLIKKKNQPWQVSHDSLYDKYECAF